VKTTVQYLDALKARLDLPSDYAAAHVLGVTRATVSKYRLGKSVFDERIAAHVAELLSLDPLEVISACKAESAQDVHMRRVWENAWGKATGAAVTTAFAACIVGLAAAPSPARSAPIRADQVMTLDYVNSRRRLFGAANDPRHLAA
jgi:hypothetical protein